MAIFGITGSVSCGKTTVLKLLKRKGAIIFDADERVHVLYRNQNSAVYRKIKKLFPQCLEGGKIRRKKLAKIVFSNANKLHQLEKIVHPPIIKDLKQWKMEAKNIRIYAAEVPLLFEKKLTNLFDGIISVYVKRNILINRIRKKFNLSKEEAIKRESLYLSIRDKIRSSDFVIDNSSSIKKLKKKVDLLWEEIKTS